MNPKYIDWSEILWIHTAHDLEDLLSLYFEDCLLVNQAIGFLHDREVISQIVKNYDKWLVLVVQFQKTVYFTMSAKSFLFLP